MAAKDTDDQPMVDRVTLRAAEAEVYEAIATLEFIGHQVTATDIVTASQLDEDTVDRVLAELIRRGMLRAGKPGQHGAASVYEPAYRGWSAAPERAAKPNR
jgi:hypothetical protein